MPRRYLALGLIVVAIVLLGTLVLVRDNSAPGTSSSTVETFTPASSSLISAMASVPASVFDSVGVNAPTTPVTPLQPTGGAGTPAWLATVNLGPPLPVVFFYGAEFAPYAAVQRWPLVLALSRFGTFHELGDHAVEPDDRVREPLDLHVLEGLLLEPIRDPRVGGALQLVEPDRGERTSASRPPMPGRPRPIASYGAGANTFALLDVANRYTLNGSSFSPAVLAGLTQDQIAGYLTSPASPLTQAVVTSANEISAAICSTDGEKPAAVCDSRGVLAADALLKITAPG